MAVGYTQREIDYLHAMSREKFEKDYSFDIRKSKEQGIAEGRMEGRIDATIQNALKALTIGIPLKQVSEFSGLSETELISLMQKN
ncbi:MAG: hypothetical protein LBM59_03300 [Ruminococcus sp.]|jgi:hypothetical protein|nr:hypothetical protein [Ruminococcus sp.]